jgi:segregation and condensation protein B
LEAVLFLAREPLALRKLAQLANLTDATEVRTLLASLRKLYDERGCAFQLAQVAGGYQLLTRREFAPWLRSHAKDDRQIRLSPPALETLAVVAYRQPALRAEVEAIRGVACGEILRQLMDRDLLRIVGRSEELGRPLRYGTTKRFLEVFGLTNLDGLPWADQLRRSSQCEAETEGKPVPFVDSNTDLTDGTEAA